jgi:hypothetical protein
MIAGALYEFVPGSDQSLPLSLHSVIRSCRFFALLFLLSHFTTAFRRYRGNMHLG